MMMMMMCDDRRFQLFLGESLTDFSRLATALQSEGLAQFLLVTDLRLRLIYPATDGNEALAQQTDLIKYYYAIADIDVVARLTVHIYHCHNRVELHVAATSFFNHINRF